MHYCMCLYVFLLGTNTRLFGLKKKKKACSTHNHVKCISLEMMQLSLTYCVSSMF